MARNFKFLTLISTIVQTISWTFDETNVVLFQKFMSRDKVSRRKVGGHAYKTYSDRQMELCLADIKNKFFTQREASVKYNIPRNSIILKLKSIRTTQLDHPV